MPQEVTLATPPRGRKRKESPAVVPTKEGKIQVHLNLTPDAFERLGVHAVVLRKDKGTIVSELIQSYLRECWIARRTQILGEADETLPAA